VLPYSHPVIGMHHCRTAAVDQGSHSPKYQIRKKKEKQNPKVIDLFLSNVIRLPVRFATGMAQGPLRAWPSRKLFHFSGSMVGCYKAFLSACLT
jgi:hypothetical protein